MVNAKSNSASNGCIAVLAVLGLLLAIGMCSSSKNKTAQSFASPSLSNQIETMAPPASAPIAPLDVASLHKGRQHLSVVFQAEGLSGAMIYSQNCYDALSRAFSWSKLDVCGGFDMLAVKAADSTNTDGLTAEVEYFGSEAAAGRYLAVATKAGEAAEDADKRLEALQRRTEALAPKARPTPTPSPEGNSEDDAVIPTENVTDKVEV